MEGVRYSEILINFTVPHNIPSMTIVLYLVVPLLFNGHEMGGYTRADSGQQLGEHFPVSRRQIFNNATVRLQQMKSYVFYVIRSEML
jgi:hypothetical protein